MFSQSLTFLVFGTAISVTNILFFFQDYNDFTKTDSVLFEGY